MPKTLLIVVIGLIFFAFTKNQAWLTKPAATIPAVESALSDSGDATATLSRASFEDGIKALYDRIHPSYNLPYNVFRLAMIGYYSLRDQGSVGNKQFLTIIDFSQPSTVKRFYTLDLEDMTVRYHTYVAHGRNTGENMATEFSNVPHSNQSSLGFYVTGETYVGSKGYSLRLDGMEENYNGNLRDRAVVVHAAAYATESWIQRYGRLGRSQGCPALPPKVAKEIIDAIKDRTAIFTYYPDENYLANSTYLKVDVLLQKLNQQREEVDPVI